MKLAIVAAGFTPGEADQLRRAMGAWRKTGVMEKFRQKLMEGMAEKGLSPEFAEAVFRQIRGFGEYGFPESHAASFALLVYVSAWLKRHYPAAFAAALLNAQPMGFYAPAQLVADARRHGVTVLPPDVNDSDWDCSLQGAERNLRLGLRQVAGLPRVVADAIVAERIRGGRFHAIAEFARRTGVGRAVLARLSQADAFASLDTDRRAALWQALGEERTAADRPLLEGLEEGDDPVAGCLPALEPAEAIAADYRTVGLSLRGHPVGLQRKRLEELRVLPAAELAAGRDGRIVRVAGLVIVRQRPSTARGITFVTLEDETGVSNLVVKPHVWERYRQVCRLSPAWLATGKLEHRSGVIHVVVSQIEDLSARIRGSESVRSRNFR